MNTALHREATVGPDGKITISVPELQPGQRVSVTIEPELALTQTAHPAGQPYTARELLDMPREERERILAAAADIAAEYYENDPDLSDFEAFGEDDLYDETPE